MLWRHGPRARTPPSHPARHQRYRAHEQLYLTHLGLCRPSGLSPARQPVRLRPCASRQPAPSPSLHGCQRQGDVVWLYALRTSGLDGDLAAPRAEREHRCLGVCPVWQARPWRSRFRPTDIRPLRRPPDQASLAGRRRLSRQCVLESQHGARRWSHGCSRLSVQRALGGLSVCPEVVGEQSQHALVSL